MALWHMLIITALEKLRTTSATVGSLVSKREEMGRKDEGVSYEERKTHNCPIET